MPIPDEIKQRIEETGRPRTKPIRPPAILPADNAERTYLSGIRERIATLEQSGKDIISAYEQADSVRRDAVGNEPFPNVIERQLGNMPIAYGAVWTEPQDIDLIDQVWEETNNNNLFHTRNAWGEALGIDPILDEPWLADNIDEFREVNVNLINSIPDTVHTQVSNIVREAWSKGWRVEKLAKELERRFQVADSRARLIARDQTAKLNGQLTQLRQEAVGITQYIWRTSLDERVRPSHSIKEGDTFDWKDPPEGTGHPGQDYQCRCWAEPDFDQLLDDLDEEGEDMLIEQTQQVPPPEPEIDWSTRANELNQHLSREYLTREQITPKDETILDATTLWTNGPLDVVRDPSLFDPSKSDKVKGPYYSSRQIWEVESPTKEDYETANRVLKQMARAPYKGEGGRVYRGIGLPNKIAQSLTKGDTFDLGDITSFSRVKDTARSFAKSTPGRRSVIITMKPKYGTGIEELSYYPDEFEVLTGGSVRILEVRSDEGVLEFIVEQK